MAILELLIIAAGLAMDAFAVSICLGVSLSEFSLKKAIKIGLYFGLFQGIMPLLGYLLGNQFANKIVTIDHWIAFALLGFIGLNMIKESREKQEEINYNQVNLGIKTMLCLAIATSIDALAIGITFAFLQVDIVFSVISIGVITFVLSMIGVKIGNLFGCRFKSRAEFSGGLVLVLMGVKILVEHLGIL